MNKERARQLWNGVRRKWEPVVRANRGFRMVEVPDMSELSPELGPADFDEFMNTEYRVERYTFEHCRWFNGDTGEMHGWFNVVWNDEIIGYFWDE